MNWDKIFFEYTRIAAKYNPYRTWMKRSPQYFLGKVRSFINRKPRLKRRYHELLEIDCKYFVENFKPWLKEQARIFNEKRKAAEEAKKSESNQEVRGA